MMKVLQGKVAFVTGGASGIGLGVVRSFLDAGMKVVAADIRQDDLDAQSNTNPATYVGFLRILRPYLIIELRTRANGRERT